MAVYTVHEPLTHPPGVMQRAERLIFVKEGFAWLAALFPLPWLLMHRMWLEFAGFLALLALLSGGIMLLGGSEQIAAWASLLLGLPFGFEARNLRRWRLERRGHQLIAAVTGRKLEDAEWRFFEVWLPQAIAGEQKSAVTPAARPAPALPPVNPPGAKNEAVIGMFPSEGG